jgi:hypothetical protein
LGVLHEAFLPETPARRLLLAGFSLSTAQAALVVPAGKPLVVNDTDMNIAWTRDANLFKTLAARDPNLVSKDRLGHAHLRRPRLGLPNH